MRNRVRRDKPQLIPVVYILKLATLKLVARCFLSILLGFSVFIFVTAALPSSSALADGTPEINPTPVRWVIHSDLEYAPRTVSPRSQCHG